jgi:hypothetical protein
MRPSIALPGSGTIDACGAGVIAACVALAYALGVHPVMDARKVAEREQARLGEAIARADQAELSVHTARRRVESLEARLAEAVRLQPAGALNERLSRLSAMADGYRLGIDRLAPAAARSGATWVEVPLSMGGTGGFADCLAFLSDLHESHPDVKVSGFRLSGGAGPDGRALPVQFGIDLVWYAEPAGLAGVDAGR